MGNLMKMAVYACNQRTLFGSCEEAVISNCQKEKAYYIPRNILDILSDSGIIILEPNAEQKLQIQYYC